MFKSGSATSSPSFIIEGTHVGAIFFIGAYNIDLSKVSFFINGIVAFILPKKIKTILKIKPIFKKPKTPPNILFIMPKEAKSANLVSIFPSKEITIIITIKVPANAAKEMYSSLQETASFRKSPKKYEKWIAPYTPIIKAAKEATSTKSPFITPLTKPKIKKTAITISKMFIP
jgi:hypothetical protein